MISALDALPADVPKDQLIAITDDLQNAISQSMQTAAGLAGALVATAASLSDEIQTLETSGIDASALTMFSSALTQIQNAVPSLQNLSSTIAAALGISAPSTLSLTVVTATSPTGTQDQDLEVMLDLKPTYSNMVNVGNLGLGGSLGPLTVSSGGMVNVTIAGNAEIDFGFDITNPGVFLLDTTSFGLTAEVDATNLSLTASIGSVSVSVGPGTVTLMDSAGDGPAAVTITTVAPATGNQIPVSAALGQRLPVQRDRRRVQRDAADHGFRHQCRHALGQPQSPESRGSLHRFALGARRDTDGLRLRRPRCLLPGSRRSCPPSKVDW